MKMVLAIHSFTLTIKTDNRMKNFLLVDMKLQSRHTGTVAKNTHVCSLLLHSLKIFSLIAFVLVTLCAGAQTTTEQQKADYTKAINERASKIASTLSLNDSVKYKKAVTVIANQYFSLNNVQEKNTQAV